MVCDTQRAKEVARRVDRASLGFEDDIDWVDSNLNEIASVIQSLQQQVRRYANEE